MHKVNSFLSSSVVFSLSLTSELWKISRRRQTEVQLSEKSSVVGVRGEAEPAALMVIEGNGC